MFHCLISAFIYDAVFSFRSSKTSLRTYFNQDSLNLISNIIATIPLCSPFSSVKTSGPDQPGSA